MLSVAVAAPHPTAVAAGQAAVAAGGNAVDAALAAAAVLAVLHPQDTSLGGDAVALVATPGGPPTAYLGVGRSALGLLPDEVRARAGDRMPVRGVDPITVPGAVGLWGQLHGAFARRPWALLLQPAVNLAALGAPVSAPLARAIAEGESLIRTDPGLAAVLTRDGTRGGELLGYGDSLVQPALAGTLLRLAEAGGSDMYRGQIASNLVRALKRRGSALTAADFADHRTMVARSLSQAWGKSTLWVAPPPTQGYALLLAVAAAAQLSDPLGRDATRLASAFSLIGDHRDRWLADAPAGDEPWAEQGAATLIAQASRLVPQGRHRGSRAAGDTVAVVAIDSDGLAVSLIQSVFHSFGSGVLDPVTGVLLHNRGASFSLDPEHRAALTPGRRPPHTLLPAIVRGPQGTVALGTMGGLAQAQVLTQVLLQLAAGKSPAAAVASPRWTLGSIEAGGDVLQLEPGLSSSARESLRESGWPVTELSPINDEVGHAQVVSYNAAGVLTSGSDPRTATTP